MRMFTQRLGIALLFCMAFLIQSNAQSVMQPSDPVVNYNAATPPTQPTWGEIGKWVRTPLITSWNTDNYKAYIYKGMPFRLHFPKTYNPTAVDGKRYPMLVFFHGLGEADSVIYHNELQLTLGHWFFDNRISTGEYDGYTISIQSAGSFGITEFDKLKEIIDYMVANNKLDPFHIATNGLSAGGQGTWEMMINNPTYITAALPMSWASNIYTDPTIMNKIRSNALWVFHGGLDGNPAPFTVYQIRDAYLSAGAHFLSTEYPEADHNTWDRAWGEPDFFGFINRAYASNPWPLGGKYDVWPGQPVNITLSLTPGFQAYEWRKDGVTISGATGNLLNVTSFGLYEARVQRNGIWSDWSHTPVNVQTKTFTNIPAKIEAENWSYMNGVKTEGTSDVGGGQNVGYIDFRDWMDYNVNVATGGNFVMKLRVATPQANGKIEIRDTTGQVLAAINVPTTGDWQTWQTISVPLTLTAGYQTIRVISTATAGFNLNWIDFATSAPGNQAPVSNAGANQTIVLPINSVQLNGSGTDADGTITAYSWTQVSGPTAATILASNQAQTSANNLVQGTYVFKLTVIDNGNAWTSSNITITVNPSPNAPVRVEAENFSSMSGVQTEGTADAGGGLNVGYIDNGDWMDYTINPAAAGGYVITLRVASPNTGASVQIKNAAGTVLTTVALPNTGGWQAWQSVSSAPITLPAGTQTLRLQSNSAAGWNINWLEYTATSTTPAPTNQLPTANAGIDKTITLPTNSVSITGTGTDPDGTIASYQWSQVSGPSTATIGTPATATTTVSNLQQGVYTLRLTVTDNSGGTATDDMTITVNAATPTPNQSPTANAGADKTITLPTNSVTITGSGTDPDGTIATYAWTQVSGPSTATISPNSAATTTVGSLQQGSYTFRLTVTDNQGATASDDVIVTVNGSVTPPTGSTHIEAENYSAMSGVQTETTSDVGGGLNVGYIDAGDWMDYIITAPSAGTYTFSFRLASQWSGGQFQVKSSNGTVLATVNTPNTGGWQTWQTITASVNLVQGTQTIRLQSLNSSSWNINWFEFSGGTAPSPNLAPTANAGSNQTITLPTNSVTLSGSGADSDGSITGYSWTKVSGPAGGNISSPSTASTSVTDLIQGTYVYRLTVTDNQGATGSATVTITVNPAPAAPFSVRIQAESYSSMSGIQTQVTNDAGGGSHVTNIDQGDWMDYSVNIPTAGSYTVNFRLASTKSSTQFQLRKSDGTVLATLNAVNTGSLQTWTTVTSTVTLPAGQQTLRIYANKIMGGLNINWWEIIQVAGLQAGSGTTSASLMSNPTAQAIEDVSGAGLGIYPNPVSDNFTLEVNHKAAGAAKIEILSATGTVLKQISLQKASGTYRGQVSAAGLGRGTYYIRVQGNGWQETKQFVKL